MSRIFRLLSLVALVATLAGLVFPESARADPKASGSVGDARSARQVKARVRQKAEGTFDRLVSRYVELRHQFRENKERAGKCNRRVRDQLRAGKARGQDLVDRARDVRRTIDRRDICRPAPRRRK